MKKIFAAAIVVASRVALVVRPEWAPGLESVLGYSQAEVGPVLRHIWSHYESNFPTETGATAASSRAADTEALSLGLTTPARLAAEQAALWPPAAAFSPAGPASEASSADSSALLALTPGAENAPQPGMGPGGKAAGEAAGGGGGAARLR